MKARNCQTELKSNTFSKVLRSPCYYKTKQSLWKCLHISNDCVKCPETPSCNIYCSWKAIGSEASKLGALNDIAIVALWMVFTIGKKKKQKKKLELATPLWSEEYGILRKLLTIRMLFVAPPCVKVQSCFFFFKAFQIHLFLNSIENRGQYAFWKCCLRGSALHSACPIRVEQCYTCTSGMAGMKTQGWNQNLVWDLDVNSTPQQAKLILKLHLKQL